MNELREATISRATKETQISVTLRLDGSGQADLRSGIGFFDHMLSALALRASWDLRLVAEGDLHIDAHHTIEDVGIVLGQALRQALGDRAGIARYGYAYAPLDEALARAVVDCSGRPYLVFDVAGLPPMLGQMPGDMVEHFCHSLITNAALTAHIDLLRGRNGHHIAEAVFKALGIALKQATTYSGAGISSTKGVLA
jgi:imidazoleglycerol-phosphate dehydratase